MNTNDQPNSSSQWETQLDSQERQAYLDLFSKVDADNKGIALKDEAMAFFTKSSVPNNILSEIWEAADDDSKGFLTAKEFCTALKLIACAQHGKLTATPILSTVVPMPYFEGVSVKPPLPANRPDTTSHTHLTSPRMTPPTTDTISPDERNNYIQLFQSSGPANGVLTADMATSIFNRSKLPSTTLQHIWNLADTRNSGTLNQTEFIIAMHYISVTMNGSLPSLPASLPAPIYAAATGRLTSSLGRHNTVIGGGESSLRPRASPELGRSASTLSPHHHTSQQQQRPPLEDFHLTHEDYAKYRPLFQQLAINETGSVSGADAVHFFRHSKLPETDLAKIWDLADTTSKGELSEQEFCLAMHLINRRMTGAQIPSALPGPISQLAPSPMMSYNATNTTFQPSVSQPSSAFTDLLGLDDQPPSSDTGASFTPNAPVTQQPPSTSNQQKVMMENNFSTIQSQVNTENSLIGSLQSQQHSMDDSLKTLQSDIEKEKQHLEKLKHTASELTRHLEAQQKKKEELTRDLQMYRQESKHYQQRIDQSQQESRELENEISELQKKAKPSSPFTSPHQMPQSPPHQQDTNVFALSSSASNHDLFANVQDAPPAPAQNNNSGSIDPFSAKHQQQKALSNATPTLNRLKEETEVRRAPTPNVDISEVEAKFPDLNMMENDFDTTSRSPTVASVSGGDHKPASPSLPSAITSPPPPTQQQQQQQQHHKQHTNVASSSPSAFSPFDSPFSSSASPNPAATSTAADPPKPPSKYGFDLAAFEGPSQPSPSSSASYRDDLTSLFGGLSPAQSPAQPSNTTAPAPPPASSFDALFNVNATTTQPQPSSAENSFDSAFLR
ncbi:hypothetical protein BCR42DRAFT_447129 [Absidia repens]|uniref:Uncharacterized protein n=1 Tax=Absidia repens TaxID=90262 RepID=A0A1X2IY91_9FUNG|nr:hypothetical protein BCR42DRAFT_447129 [Absidia repens]